MSIVYMVIFFILVAFGKAPTSEIDKHVSQITKIYTLIFASIY